MEELASCTKKRKTPNTQILREQDSNSPDENLANLDSSSSSSSESDDNIEVEDDIVASQEDNLVVAHEASWIMNTSFPINAYKDGEYPAKLLNRKPRIDSELEAFLLFFPDIEPILQYSNYQLRMRRKNINKKELFKTIGALYAMSVNVLSPRRKYWSTKDDCIFPPPAFGQRFGLGLHRFEEILGVLSFANPENDLGDDRWYQVRALVDLCNEKWATMISPGYKITVDESMFAWYGRGSYEENGMPAVMKIKRKPKGVGCEVKTAADSGSRIMIQMEINEGKEAMKDKKFQKDFGAGTATTLRLTETWHGSGRIVVGDSWFSSVKTSIELKKRGMFYIGCVKTATSKFPIKELIRRCPEERGGQIFATANIDNIQINAAGWRDKKVHTYVSTCSTSLNGSPCKKRRVDEMNKVFYKEVKRPKIAEEYHDGSPAVDIHNHLRQGGLALEEVWGTQNWQHRMFACIFGIIECNAYLAFKYFNLGKENLTHQCFTEALAMQLLTYDLNRSETQANPTAETVVVCHTKQNVTQNGLSPESNGAHTLRALSKDDERQRVQRKCVICSRVRKTQQKASYYCTLCGKNVVLCSPSTGRNCFAYHVSKGVPIK